MEKHVFGRNKSVCVPVAALRGNPSCERILRGCAQCVMRLELMLFITDYKASQVKELEESDQRLPMCLFERGLTSVVILVDGLPDLAHDN